MTSHCTVVSCPEVRVAFSHSGAGHQEPNELLLTEFGNRAPVVIVFCPAQTFL